MYTWELFFCKSVNKLRQYVYITLLCNSLCQGRSKTMSIRTVGGVNSELDSILDTQSTIREYLEWVYF